MSGLVSRLAVDQPVQQVQHMRLGRHARIQSQFHSADDDLFVVMKNESKDIDHLTITARRRSIVDQAGWHVTPKLKVPDNITLLFLPPRSPELNPVANLWQFMRENWLSNRIFKDYEGHRFPLLRRMEQAGRTAMEDHLDWNA